MGHYSWRCAKTTKGIPIQRYEPTEVIAFLPNGDRVSGFLGNYGELLNAQFLNSDHQPTQGPDHLLDAASRGVYQLIGKTSTPPIPSAPDGGVTMDMVDQLEDKVKLVLVEDAEPGDTYDNLPTSHPDPWGGWMYEFDEQRELELELAVGFDPMPFELSDADDDSPGPG